MASALERVQRNREIVADFLCGHSQEGIARKHGISSSAVSSIIVSAGHGKPRVRFNSFIKTAPDGFFKDLSDDPGKAYREKITAPANVKRAQEPAPAVASPAPKTEASREEQESQALAEVAKAWSASPQPRPPSFVCPACSMESFNPNDIAHRYCGFCKTFHNPPPVRRVPWPKKPADEEAKREAAAEFERRFNEMKARALKALGAGL